MRKLVKRNTMERESVVAFGMCVCGCGCPGNCTCPIAPSHQIGIGVREQNQDSSGNRSVGATTCTG